MTTMMTLAVDTVVGETPAWGWAWVIWAEAGWEVEVEAAAWEAETCVEAAWAVVWAWEVSISYPVCLIVES